MNIIGRYTHILIWSSYGEIPLQLFERKWLKILHRWATLICGITFKFATTGSHIPLLSPTFTIDGAALLLVLLKAGVIVLIFYGLPRHHFIASGNPCFLWLCFSPSVTRELLKDPLCGCLWMRSCWSSQVSTVCTTTHRTARHYCIPPELNWLNAINCFRLIINIKLPIFTSMDCIFCLQRVAHRTGNANRHVQRR